MTGCKFKARRRIIGLSTCRITIPFRKPFILPVYVEQVLKLLDEMGLIAEE